MSSVKDKQLIRVTHRRNSSSMEWEGGTKENQAQKRFNGTMDPDGFGFDSSVNYLGDPCTQMNSPGVKQAISLPLMEKPKVMLALSLDYLRRSSCSQLTWDQAAGPGWMRKRMTEWMNRWNRDCNDEQSVLCQRRGRVTQVGPEMTILVKRPDGAQWCTCAGKVPTFSRTLAGMPQTIYPEKEIFILNFCILFLFFVLI